MPRSTEPEDNHSAPAPDTVTRRTILRGTAAALPAAALAADPAAAQDDPTPAARPPAGRRRARQAGIVIGDGKPGRHNAITDVPGVQVGQTTLIGNPPDPRRGPVRTGVTVIRPHGGDVFSEPRYAGFHWLNGNGEMTGTAWIEENGMLSSPIALTNTGSVGVVRDALQTIEVRTHPPEHVIWSLPVVAETWDGTLNDINGQHVRPEHVFAAYHGANGGPVAEGNVGGGTGMICHEFKGGTGTSSRVLDKTDGGWTVGVLVQANHGIRRRLTIAGAPVGEVITPDVIPTPGPAKPLRRPGSGSIIIIVATDAPLLPHTCTRLAQRTSLAIGRTGGAGENDSGDGMLAFSTTDPYKHGEPSRRHTYRPDALDEDTIDPLFYALIDATEEAILNCLLMAETMTGMNGTVAHALDEQTLIDALARYHRGPRAHPS